MLNATLESVISKTVGGEPREDPSPLLGHAEQRCPADAGELATVEAEGDLAASQASAVEPARHSVVKVVVLRLPFPGSQQRYGIEVRRPCFTNGDGSGLAGEAHSFGAAPG